MGKIDAYLSVLRKEHEKLDLRDLRMESVGVVRMRPTDSQLRLADLQGRRSSQVAAVPLG